MKIPILTFNLSKSGTKFLWEEGLVHIKISQCRLKIKEDFMSYMKDRRLHQILKWLFFGNSIDRKVKGIHSKSKKVL